MFKIIIILFLISTNAWANTNYCNDASANVCLLAEEQIGNIRDVAHSAVCTAQGFAIPRGYFYRLAGKFGAAIGVRASGTNNGGNFFCGQSGFLQPTFAQFPITLMVWVHKTGSATNTAPIYGTEGKLNGNLFYSGAWISLANTGKDVLCGYSDNTTSTLLSGSRITTATNVLPGDQTTWSHIACVFRGATDMTMYINGVAQTSSYTGSGGNMANRGGSDGFRIGRDTSASLGEYNADFDEIGVFKREMTATEVSDIVNNGLTGNIYIMHSINNAKLNNAKLN